MDSWVPKENANQRAVDDWVLRKKDNRRGSFNESDNEEEEEEEVQGRGKQKKKTKATPKKSTKAGAQMAKGKK